MREVDYGQLKPDGEYLSDLGADVWLMDDHRWAFLVWTRFSFEREIGRFSLVHADRHWDGVNDFHENEEARDRLLAADLAEIETMVRDEERIQYDSFIAPAVIRKLVAEVHFFCKQTGAEPGLGERLLADTGAREYGRRNARFSSVGLQRQHNELCDGCVAHGALPLAGGANKFDEAVAIRACL